MGKVYATRLAKACVKGELDQSPTHPAPHRNRSGGRNFGVKKEMRQKMGGELRRLRKARSDPIKPQLVLLDLSLRKKGETGDRDCASIQKRQELFQEENEGSVSVRQQT